MESIKNLVDTARDSALVKFALVGTAFGAVPFYFLTMVVAQLR